MRIVSGTGIAGIVLLIVMRLLPRPAEPDDDPRPATGDDVPPPP